MTEMSLMIRLVHGPDIHLKGQRSDKDVMNFGSNVERGMDAPYLGFEIDGALTLIPNHNIASVEISPSPSNVLIKGIIRDVQRAG